MKTHSKDLFIRKIFERNNNKSFNSIANFFIVTLKNPKNIVSFWSEDPENLNDRSFH